MNKAINILGRVSLYFLIGVSMYCAMVDPVIRIALRMDDNPLLCIIGWTMLIPFVHIEEHFLPVFNYDKGTDAHVK